MKRSTLLAFAALGATALVVGPAVAGGLQTAIFSGGCFWTMEHGFEGVPGVVKAVSGFKLGLPIALTGMKVPFTDCSVVWGSGIKNPCGGARKVVPTEPRTANAEVICHLARAWGLNVLPP